MKSVLVFLAAVLAVSQAGEPDTKCPQPYLSQLKPAVLKDFLGVWYAVRASIEDEEHKDAACVSKTIWRTTDTPATQVHSVSMHQINGTWEYKQAVGSFKLGAVDGEVETQWQWQAGPKTINSIFVESDGGQQWGIGHSCFDDEKNNTISVWAVLSRTKKMDPKLEQILVEKIEKYSGLTQDKLRGVRQTGCYELNYKESV